MQDVGGLSWGGAVMSNKHCNFMINNGDATSDDLEKLGELVREKVAQIHGVELNWEIKIIGQPTTKKQQQVAA